MPPLSAEAPERIPVGHSCRKDRNSTNRRFPVLPAVPASLAELELVGQVLLWKTPMTSQAFAAWKLPPHVSEDLPRAAMPAESLADQLPGQEPILADRRPVAHHSEDTAE